MKSLYKFRSKVIVICFLLGTTICNGQLSVRLIDSRIESIISTSYPPQLLIENYGMNILDAYIVLEITDEVQFQERFKVNSIDLNTGLNYISDYSSTEAITSNGGILIPGSYKCLVSIYKSVGEKEIVHSAILKFLVVESSLIPLSPQSIVMGNTPIQFCVADQSFISSASYVLSIWSCDNLDETLIRSYEYPPLFQYYFNSACIMLPFNLPALEMEKKYYWQVDLVSDGIRVARTPLMNLKLSDQRSENNSKYDYRLIEPKINDGSYMFGNILRFAYNNKFNESRLKYKLIELNGGKSIKAKYEISLVNGLNYIDFELVGIPGLIYGKTYLLEIQDRTNIKYSIQFTLNQEGRK